MLSFKSLFSRLTKSVVYFLTHAQVASFKVFTCSLYFIKAVFKLAQLSFAWNMAKTTVLVLEFGCLRLAIWKAILNDPPPASPPSFMCTSFSGIALFHVSLPFLK